MEDFVTEKNEFSENNIFALILEVMQINKCVKAKYVR